MHVADTTGADSTNDRFLRACRLEPVDRTPVWFMRQAGRYLPEYRALRESHDILQLCRTPELAAEVTLMPLRRMDVDAAILFSDIMVPIAEMGVDLRIESGVGPIIDNPIRDDADLDRLRYPFEPDAAVPYVLEAIRILRKELEVPLIGFAGAPFTLASYLIEGGPSKNFARTKALMHAEPRVWNNLMVTLVLATRAYLRAQVEAGVQAVQIFDSWVGTLDPADYGHHVLPHMRQLIAGLDDLSVPTIHFGVGTGELLPLMRDAGSTVMGVDWRVLLNEAWDRVGETVAIQGNLDPAVCLAPWETVQLKAFSVLRRAAGRPGHIFNLGHGVLPGTPPENLERLVDLVHDRTEAANTDTDTDTDTDER
jgi:uroporphyrinogen decarboxylase